LRAGIGDSILRAFARLCGREIAAVGIRLVAYVGALALLTWLAIDLFPAVQVLTQSFKSEKPQWVLIERPHAAFAVAFHDLPNSVYRALRDPAGGGRKDIITLDGSGRSALVEIYRPGRELTEFAAPEAEIASRVAALGTIEGVEPAPALETRFGAVSLVDFTLVDGERRHGCLGFVRSVQDPPLQISGWLCNAGPGMVGRTTLACAFDKLTLLSAGSDPKLQHFFAQAELKGAYCVHKRVRPSAAARPMDWIDGRQAAKLRGTAAR
jgi:hypothetical protein